MALTRQANASESNDLPPVPALRLPRPRALVLDMDGLLLDTERLYLEINRAVAGQLGYDMAEAVNLGMVGLAIDRCRQHLADAFGADFPFDRFRQLGYVDMDARLAAGVPLRTGALELVRWAHDEGLPLAVATSTARERATHHLQETGILPLLDHLIAREDVANTKPAPDPYLLAASRLGIAPADALALEDSANGVRSAAAAGMPVVMVPDLILPDNDLNGLALAVVPSLADVLAALR